MHSMKVCRTLAMAAVALGLAASATGFAEESATGMTTVIPGDMKLSEMKWSKADKAMPHGMRVLALYGDRQSRARTSTASVCPPRTGFRRTDSPMIM